MSRGHGWVQRRIIEIVDGGLFYDTLQMAGLVFGGVDNCVSNTDYRATDRALHKLQSEGVVASVWGGCTLGWVIGAPLKSRKYWSSCQAVRNLQNYVYPFRSNLAGCDGGGVVSERRH